MDFTRHNEAAQNRRPPRHDYEYIGRLLDKIADGTIRERAEHLMLWYAVEADRCKRRYYVCTFFSIGAPLLITVINTLCVIYSSVGLALSVLVSALSAAGCFFSSALTVTRSQENWIRYRQCAELLKSETIRYLTASGAYRGLPEADRGLLYIERIESVAIQESSSWFKMRCEQGKKEPANSDTL